MKAIAQASHKRSLADFQEALKEYHKELEEDVIVKAHLGTLYDTMLEQNLCRIIEPYSLVQVYSKVLPELSLSASHLLYNHFFNSVVIGEERKDFVRY